MDLRNLIDTYLSETNQLQLATCAENKPWIATVYFAHDEKLNLYWLSRRGRRHSKELYVNAPVAAAVVKQHTVGDKVRGIQCEGTSHEATDDYFEIAHQLFSKKFGTKDEVKLKASEKGENVTTYFMLIPRRFVLTDALNFPTQAQQEYIVTQK